MKSIIQILFIMITLQTTAQEVVLEGQNAPDFTASAINGNIFQLSHLKGKKIFLSFFRNGACALCNLRVHEIALHEKEFEAAGIEVVAVFESSVDDMKPFVGKQKVSFTLLSDPTGKIYELFGVRNAPETIQKIIASGSATGKVAEAEKMGFKLTPQEGANFFRVPAEVLIDENFKVVKVHHCQELIDHLPISEILKF